jgi:K+-transporting ATPase ATPase A chain
MTVIAVLKIGLLFGLVLLCTKPLGLYIARVMEGRRSFLHPLLGWLERWTYRVAGVRQDVEQHWTQYSASLLSFSLAGFVILYLLQRVQGILPFNPQRFSSALVSPDLAFNTAVSFVTNTNWQAYSGESTLSYFVQMAGLTVQNFLSAAAGVALAMAVIRGFARQQSRSVGNLWVDVTRAGIYVLLPIAVAGALLYVSQGVIQNLSAYSEINTVEGTKQIIAQGPVASQEAIKQLGTNGGGFFNANAAHPSENPTPVSNLLGMLLILVIPAALTYTFGRCVGDQRQGWAIFAAMSILLLSGALLCVSFEQQGHPVAARVGVELEPTGGQSGGNMEGKEVRFGVVESALFATVTTATSCGAVIAMHDSFTALGGLIPLFNMMTGEAIFGGVGVGLVTMLMYGILAVFIAGLMVGRTPEYLGKKIERKEVKMAMLAVLSAAFSLLVLTALASVVTFPQGSYWNAGGAPAANINNRGPHGFSEVLYAYASGTGNNGSAFAGLSANTPWYNLTIGLAMWMGRFVFLIPLLAAAGSLAAKKKTPMTAGTFPTHGPLFIGLLVGTVVLLGALTYFPALSLGPIVEHYLVQAGASF